jgi:hypothetical protein
MLAAPLKKSLGSDTSWVEPLQGYLRNNYGKEDAQRQNPSLQRLTTARMRALTATAPEEHMFDYLTSYLQMLVAVEPRFPIGEVRERVRLDITTYSYYSTSETVRMYCPFMTTCFLTLLELH